MELMALSFEQDSIQLDWLAIAGRPISKLRPVLDFSVKITQGICF